MSNTKKIALTGIKPTGVPHIGNYLGAIKPALELADNYDARYFIADYHALNSLKDRDLLKSYTYEVAATWLACGLDPDKVLFYRQSDVPQIFELTTMIMAFTSKGLMNRAHAYKAIVADNLEKEKDPDNGVNMGLFTYPVLMAADILMFDADYVPVGKDQIQHIEIAADIAEAFNSNYKVEALKIPTGIASEETQTITGLDGRKMSKSYNNTISLFLPEKQLRKIIMKIVTNSQEIDEPKDPDSCNVFALYKLFATKEQQEALAERYRAGGLGWGHAKQELFELLNTVVAPMREKYFALMDDKSYIDKVLVEGAQKARDIAQAKIEYLRGVIGF
ncbi:MAG: tryptophan--tRNA ligase [Spirochaetales bacterium]|nr:tryptophan--tRNA ligase [Spirochaetales bacterium]